MDWRLSSRKTAFLSLLVAGTIFFVGTYVGVRVERNHQAPSPLAISGLPNVQVKSDQSYDDSATVTSPDPTPGNPEKIFCPEESRSRPLGCSRLQSTVCGWRYAKDCTGTEICHGRYQSACLACLNPQVEYFTEGVCPESK